MTVGAIAGLIAAIAFVALVALAAVPLLKLGRVLEEVRLAVRDIGHESVPILTELQGTVRATNAELEKLSLVTEDVAKVSANATVVSENAAQMTSLFSATLGGPLIKTAALTYGVRKALRGDGSRRAEPKRGAEHDPAASSGSPSAPGVAIFVDRQDPRLAAPGQPRGGRAAGGRLGGRGRRLGARLRRPGPSCHGRARGGAPRRRSACPSSPPAHPLDIPRKDHRS